MQSIFSLLNTLFTKLSLVLIFIYQKTISPDEWILSPMLKWTVCAHEPHCSEYARLSLVRYGFLDSIEQIITRIISCRPSMTKTYDPVSYRVVFASSAPIGVPFLQALAADPRFDIVGVVTQPDQPVGRGLKMTPNIIKTEAEKLQIDAPLEKHSSEHKGGWRGDFVVTPRSLRLDSKKYADDAVSFDSRLKEKNSDFLVVIAYGNIIPQHILDIPTIAPINVHGSLLPAYRGASPIQSVLLDDQSETGITIMRMDAGLDTWPMLRKQWFPLTIHTTALDIIHKFQEFGPQLLIDTMVGYATGKVQEIPQPQSPIPPEKGDTAEPRGFCSKLEKTHGLINPWTQSLHEINNIYRGCYLWPKTYFVLDDSRGKHAGKQIIIDTLELDETLWEAHKDSPLLLGEVGWGSVKQEMKLSPAITNLLIKPEWSKAMKWEDWLRGL
jgi:methionyl-tRNA formyltransferase